MLSDEWVKDLATGYFADDWAVRKAIDIIRETEDEVRKQDTELIRQILEALDDGAEHTAQCITNYYNRQCDCGKAQAITAARARLREA